MAQDPLAQVKLTLRQAIAYANAQATQNPDAAAAFLNLSAMLSTLVGAGNTLDKATLALLQCRKALAPVNGISAVGAVQAQQGQPPAGYVGSTTAAGIALGALVVGAGAGFAGGNWFGKRPKKAEKSPHAARPNPLGIPPRMGLGYALKLDPKTGEWHDVVTPKNAASFRFVKKEHIEGEPMAVFMAGSGATYAQSETMAREPLGLAELPEHTEEATP